jgi:hypothetical protein
MLAWVTSVPVAALARVPAEAVVAAAEVGAVVAFAAVDRVVAVAAPVRLVLGRDLHLAALERVVAAPTRDCGRDGVGERAVRIVDAGGIVAAAHPDLDGGQLIEIEREVGRAVVVNVDLDPGRVAGLQTESDPVGATTALDLERAVLRLGPHVVERLLVRARAGRGDERREQEPGEGGGAVGCPRGPCAGGRHA